MKPTITHTKPTAAAVLLAEAAVAGVSVRAEGDVLRVRGPRAHETLIRALLARKGEVLAALNGSTGEAAEAAEAATTSTSTSTSPAPPPPPPEVPPAAEGVAAPAGRTAVAAAAVAPEPAPEPPSDPEADAILAEVLALLPRVNTNWQSYIRTRLGEDTGSAERLRVVRDRTLAHAELAPEKGPDRDAAPAGAVDD